MESQFIAFIDFDGTISQIDSLEFILDTYTGNSWRQIEDLVSQNQLNEIDALQKEFDLLDICLRDAIKLIRQIPIDPYFKKFLQFCNLNKINITILSGSFDIFIREIFKNHKIKNLQIRSNSVNIKKNKWTVIPSKTPKIHNKCNHCKNNWIKEAQQKNKKTIYIGDGNTDRCPAQNAEYRFAKNGLRDYFVSKGIFLYPYKNFQDIIEILHNDILKLSIREKIIA
jgi:2-hydroxy-3-keto-5-methylthiopentenyl-1-phosphate phosphatase